MANIGRRGAQLCARLGNVFVWIYHVALWPLLRATRRLVASASPSGWHTKEPRVMAARATRTTKTLPQLFEVRRNPGDFSSLLVFFFRVLSQRVPHCDEPTGSIAQRAPCHPGSAAPRCFPTPNHAEDIATAANTCPRRRHFEARIISQS